jgi:hypothetical protein
MLDAIMFIMLRSCTIAANGIEEAQGQKTNAGIKLHLAQ